MKKLVIYGHDLCPDCHQLLKTLDENEIEYTFNDMTKSVSAVKEFANLREARPEFDKVKEAGGLGIPCVVVNDGEEILFDDLSLDQVK